jgi:hypothetical protein
MLTRRPQPPSIGFYLLFSEYSSFSVRVAIQAVLAHVGALTHVAEAVTAEDRLAIRKPTLYPIGVVCAAE